jgi:hypothetical protein
MDVKNEWEMGPIGRRESNLSYGDYMCSLILNHGKSWEVVGEICLYYLFLYNFMFYFSCIEGRAKRRRISMLGSVDVRGMSVCGSLLKAW